MTSLWGSRSFPSVPQAVSKVGGSSGYQYYAINVDNITDKYFGQIALAPAPGHAQAQYMTWISRTPGGAPVSNECSSLVGYDSIMSWGKNMGSKLPSYACNLESGTYYINVSDGRLPGNSGTCSLSTGCSYLMNISGTKQR